MLVSVMNKMKTTQQQGLEGQGEESSMMVVTLTQDEKSQAQSIVFNSVDAASCAGQVKHSTSDMIDDQRPQCSGLDQEQRVQRTLGTVGQETIAVSVEAPR